MPAYSSIEHPEGSWRALRHLGTQRATGHLGSQRALGQLRHSGTQALGHLDTWALGHLGTRGTLFSGLTQD